MGKGRRRERVVEVIANPQLIAGDPSHNSDVRSDGLLELKALLDGPVVLAAEPAAEKNRVEHLRIGQLKKSGIQILQLRASVARPAKRAGENQQSENL